MIAHRYATNGYAHRAPYIGAMIVLGIAYQSGCSPPESFEAMTVPANLQPTGEAFTAGREILQESQEAYRNVESYVGTVEVTGTTGYQSGLRPVKSRFFEVEFRSPNYLHLTGADSNGDPFAILIDGERTDVKHAGMTKHLPSAEHALYAYGGSTLGGSYFLPGCLLDVSWKNEGPDLPKDASFLAAWATKSALVGIARVDDEDCYRVLCERDTGSWMIYVGKESKLMRRVDHSTSETQMNRLLERNWGGGASGNVISMSRSYIFRINRFDLKASPQDDRASDSKP